MASHGDILAYDAAPAASSPTTIELDALLRDYLLGLVLIAGAGPDAGARPVQWVHSSDLADPSPFLTPRTVLLTTGAQFGQTVEGEDASAYVSRLVSAGTTALGVAIGVQWDRIPPALISACDRQQLPLFRVPYDTPFIAVVRTAARLIEAETHAAEQREAERAALGSLYGRRQSLAATEHALRDAVLRLLLAGHKDLAEQIASPLLPRLPREQLVVLSFDGVLGSAPLAELAPLTTARDGVFSVQRDRRVTVIAEHREVQTLRRALERHDVATGISERGSMLELPELLEQAERAAELAELRQLGSPLDYRPAMHAGVLQLLQASPEAVRRAQGLLAPLRRHDERHRDELERSLTAWLAHHGQTSTAAAELGVHRHTLRARVRTAANLLQRDLETPDARVELWAALRLAPLQSSDRAQAPGGSTP